MAGSDAYIYPPLHQEVALVQNFLPLLQPNQGPPFWKPQRPLIMSDTQDTSRQLGILKRLENEVQLALHRLLYWQTVDAVQPPYILAGAKIDVLMTQARLPQIRNDLYGLVDILGIEHRERIEACVLSVDGAARGSMSTYQILHAWICSLNTFQQSGVHELLRRAGYHS